MNPSDLFIENLANIRIMNKILKLFFSCLESIITLGQHGELIFMHTISAGVWYHGDNSSTHK